MSGIKIRYYSILTANDNPTEKISGIPLESTGILVEFYSNSSGIKGTFFHWKRVIPVEVPFDSSGIPLDSSGIPLDSSGILIEFHLIPVEIPLDSSAKTALINPLHRTTKFTQNSVSYL